MADHGTGLTLRKTKLPDEETFATIKAALESGCNYFNAGEFYGPPDNNSLTLLRDYFEKYPEDRDKIVLNVKGCINAQTFSPDTTPEGVKRSVENCLRVIGGKGRIDQFEPARKDSTVEIETTVKALQEQVDAGNIGGISLSEVSAATLRRAAKVAKIESVEVELSLWCTEPLENGLAQACAELNIPILAYCELPTCLPASPSAPPRPLQQMMLTDDRSTTAPLGRGMLTGQIKSFDDLPEGDWRRSVPRFQPAVFEQNLQLVREVQQLAAKKGCTPGQLAIGWVLALNRRPGMPTIIPIPGASRPERVRENAVEVEVTEEEMEELEKIAKEYAPLGERYAAHGMKHLDTSTE